MADRVKVVKPDAPRDVLSQQGPRPGEVHDAKRFVMSDPRDTARLDFLIKQAVWPTVRCHLEGTTAEVQLDRKYIDNAMARQAAHAKTVSVVSVQSPSDSKEKSK